MIRLPVPGSVVEGCAAYLAMWSSSSSGPAGCGCWCPSTGWPSLFSCSTALDRASLELCAGLLVHPHLLQLYQVMDCSGSSLFLLSSLYVASASGCRFLGACVGFSMGNSDMVPHWSVVGRTDLKYAFAERTLLVYSPHVRMWHWIVLRVSAFAPPYYRLGVVAIGYNTLASQFWIGRGA